MAARTIFERLKSTVQTSRLLVSFGCFWNYILRSQVYQFIQSTQQLNGQLFHFLGIHWQTSFSHFFWNRLNEKLNLWRFNLSSIGLKRWRRIFEDLIILLIIFMPVLKWWQFVLPVLILFSMSIPEQLQPSYAELGLFWLALFIGAVLTLKFPVGIQNLSDFTTWIFMAFLVGKTFNKELVLRFMRCFLWTSFIWVSIGFFQQWAGVATPPGWLSQEQGMFISIRSYSVFSNPNIYALYLLVLLGLGVFLLDGSFGWRRYIGVLILISVNIALFFTFSRIAWLLGGLFLLTLFWRQFRSRGLFVCLVVFGLLIFSEQFKTRLVTLFSLNDSSFWYRLRIWQGVGRAIANNWLWGTGPGGFPIIYPWFQIENTPSTHTHQLYLQLWLENGFLSLIAFIWFIKRLLTGYPYPQRLTQTLAMVIIIFLAYGFTETWSQNRVIGGYFWFFCGLLIAVKNEEKMAS